MPDIVFKDGAILFEGGQIMFADDPCDCCVVGGVISCPGCAPAGTYVVDGMPETASACASCAYGTPTIYTFDGGDFASDGGFCIAVQQTCASRYVYIILFCSGGIITDIQVAVNSGVYPAFNGRQRWLVNVPGGVEYNVEYELAPLGALGFAVCSGTVPASVFVTISP